MEAQQMSTEIASIPEYLDQKYTLLPIFSTSIYSNHTGNHIVHTLSGLEDGVDSLKAIHDVQQRPLNF
jgi:hypothetical protein